jgi:hypothetical protein
LHDVRRIDPRSQAAVDPGRHHLAQSAAMPDEQQVGRLFVPLAGTRQQVVGVIRQVSSGHFHSVPGRILDLLLSGTN